MHESDFNRRWTSHFRDLPGFNFEAIAVRRATLYYRPRKYGEPDLLLVSSRGRIGVVEAFLSKRCDLRKETAQLRKFWRGARRERPEGFARAVGRAKRVGQRVMGKLRRDDTVCQAAARAKGPIRLFLVTDSLPKDLQQKTRTLSREYRLGDLPPIVVMTFPKNRLNVAGRIVKGRWSRAR